MTQVPLHAGMLFQHGLSEVTPPIVSGVTGPTHGHNERARIVSEAFFNALLQDVRVQQLYRRWDEQTGLDLNYRRLLMALRQVVAISGLHRPSDWLRGAREGWTVEIEDEDAPRLAARVAEAEQVLDDLCAGLEVTPPLLEQARDFVRALGLPSWRWVRWELVKMYHARIDLALDEDCLLQDVSPEFVILGMVPHPRWLSAPVSLEFVAEPGEDLTTALQRLETVTERARQDLLASAPSEPEVPRGTLPKERAASLVRDAIWFYRHRVGGESLRQIALTDFAEDENAEDKRKVVREGIRRAERLLNLRH